MKKYLIVCAMVSLAFQAVAQETQWNTARGNTYQIYQTLKWTPHSETDRKKLPTTLFVITYLTKTDPKNEAALFSEYDDLMMHFYYFYAPENLKTMNEKEKQKYYVVTEALTGVPTAEKKQAFSHRLTKNLVEVEKLAKGKAGIDPKRLEALTVMNNKKLPEAISLFKEIQSKMAYDYYQISNAYIHLSKYDEAKKWAQDGLQKFSKDVRLLHNMAAIYIFEGSFNVDGKLEYDPEKMNAAKKNLAQIFEVDKNNTKALLTLSTAEIGLGNYAEAEKILKNARETSLNPWLVDKRLADFYYLWKKKDLAIKTYEGAIAARPGEPSLLEGLGEIYHAEKKYTKAKEYYSQAVSIFKVRQPASEFEKDEIKKLQEKITKAEEKKAL